MDFNTILIVLGVLALILLIAHGIWSNRREKSQYFENENTFTSASRIREPARSPYSQHNEIQRNSAQSHHLNEEEKQQSLDFEDESSPNHSMGIDAEVNGIKITLPKSNQTRTATVTTIDETIPDLANTTIADLENSIDPEEGINSSSPVIREELYKMSQNPFAKGKVEYPMESKPKYQSKNPILTPKTEIKITSDESNQSNLDSTKELEAVSENNPNNNEDNFMMLYIVAPENRDFNGTNIEQVLDNLGFIYGEKQIYHRHLDLSITSPILFSVANIQQPGTFDPDNMANFYTIGLAIFMQLPSYGNDLANLRLMIRAARNIAEDLGGFVLTDKQVIFTDEAEQEYLNKVA